MTRPRATRQSGERPRAEAADGGQLRKEPEVARWEHPEEGHGGGRPILWRHQGPRCVLCVPRSGTTWSLRWKQSLGSVGTRRMQDTENAGVRGVKGRQGRGGRGPRLCVREAGVPSARHPEPELTGSFPV